MLLIVNDYKTLIMCSLRGFAGVNMGCPGVHAQVTHQNGYAMGTICSGRVYASILHVFYVV
jgi:hypothetical protein